MQRTLQGVSLWDGIETPDNFQHCFSGLPGSPGAVGETAHSVAATFIFLRVQGLGMQAHGLTFLLEKRDCAPITDTHPLDGKPWYWCLHVGLFSDLNSRQSPFPSWFCSSPQYVSILFTSVCFKIFLFWANAFPGFQALVFRFLEDLVTKIPPLLPDLFIGIPGMEFVIFSLVPAHALAFPLSVNSSTIFPVT